MALEAIAAVRRAAREADSIKLPKLGDAGDLPGWKLAVRHEVAAASARYEDAFKWIKEVELPGRELLSF